jgi:hypothetical protein
MRPESLFNFDDARKKALNDSLSALLKLRKNTVIPFEEVRRLLRSGPELYRGILTVPVEKIVGSENRFDDFSLRFLPKKKNTKHRWMSIDTAFLEGQVLPPVVLYEVGGLYFVRDGNHRVSVAKSQGVQYLDAEVVSLSTEVRLSPSMGPKDIRKAILEYEEESFKASSGLPTDEKGFELRFSEIALYDRIVADIERHRLFLAEERVLPLGFREAAQSWFRDVYKPFISVLTGLKLSKRFPGRTSGDLYVWIARFIEEREKELSACILPEDGASAYRERFVPKTGLRAFLRGKRNRSD